MSDTAEARRALSVPCVLGDCAIQLSHATTYEPPLYLFPELLPRVPQGSAPVVAWDAVADAVDVGASFWNLADVSRLCAVTTSENESCAGAPQKASRPPTTTTLASLISANRLIAAGLSARVLREDGGFSAASMMEELLRLRARAGLSEEEGTVILSNHFVNLLAWKKLREINHAAPHDRAACPRSSPIMAHKRRRQDELDTLDTLRAAPDPWSDAVDDPRHAGLYISGREEDVQDRVELLATLGKLYRRPWRTLRSQGQQTDQVVPAGTISVTSPYADGDKLPGATLRIREDLGWPLGALAALPVSDSALAKHGDGTSPASRAPARSAAFTVMVRSGSQSGLPARTVALQTGRTYYFGRKEGLQHSRLTGALDVDVGLGRFSGHAEYVAPLHFALCVRASRAGAADAEDDTTGAAVGTGSAGGELWFIGYGSNGTRVLGTRWLLAEPMRLHKGTELVVAHDVYVRVLGEDEEMVGSADGASGGGVVKLERIQDDE